MEGFADIEGPVRIGLWGLVGLAVLGILLLGGLAALLIWYVRRHRHRQEIELSVQRSPLEIALDRLQRLQSGDSHLDADPFVVEVSDIVRDYLETAMRIPAREQTSEEFLLALQQMRDLPPVLRDHMPDFLEQCDLVKFARQLLEARQRDALLSTAGTVVRETDAALRAPATVGEKEVAG